MCVHECARRAIYVPSWPATLDSKLGSNTGHHNWPALLKPLASNTGHQQWSAPLAGIIGQDAWQHALNMSMMMAMMMAMMIMMMMMTLMMMIMTMVMVVVVMVMNGDDELTLHSNMCMHACARRANNWPSWPATLDSNTGNHHWPAPLVSTINATGQQHCPPPVVSTTGRHH